MPILGPRSKFGAPFGLRGGESRGCVRRPKQNRSGSRGIGQANEYRPCGEAAKNEKTQFVSKAESGVEPIFKARNAIGFCFFVRNNRIYFGALRK
jgi:hypothetical protein